MKHTIKFALVALVFAAGACGSGKMKEAGGAFMEALKASDAEKSYAMLDASVQKEVGDIEAWKKFIETRKPATWTISGFTVKAGGTGELTGDAVFSDGVSYDISFVLAKAGEDWKISGFTFKAQKK